MILHNKTERCEGVKNTEENIIQRKVRIKFQRERNCWKENAHRVSPRQRQG
jgi:hypothetical protein